MKRIILALILVLNFPYYSIAGEIFGIVKNSGRNDIKVIVKCGSEHEDDYVVDRYGGYKMYVNYVGVCDLNLRINGIKSLPISIRVGKHSIRYNLRFYKQKNEYFLERI